MLRIMLSTIVFSLLTASCLYAQQANWEHWRGPNENGSVDAGNPPLNWGPDKNILWKTPIPGAGSSTPIITGDQVIILTAVKSSEAEGGAAAETDQGAAEERQADQRQRREDRGEGDRRERGERGAGGERQGRQGRGGRGGGGFGRGGAPTESYRFMVISYDRNDGSKQWETVLTEQVPHEGVHSTNNYAPSSPVTDGQNIYVDYGSRGIYCLDMEGNIKWKQELGQMRTRNSFGEGSSSAIAGDKLIVPWDHEGDSFIAALNRETGEIVWKVDRDEATTWATPLIVQHKGRTQVIASGTVVRSYDADTGELIWSCGGQVGNPIPTPILFNDHVIVMTGYRGNAIYSISLDSEGDVSETEMVAWSNKEAAPYVPSAVLYQGQLYLNRTNNNIITSLDAATGEVLISPQRLRGLGDLYSSPVAANGHIYFTGRDGQTVVVEHGTDLKIVATNALNEVVDSSLAIVGDRIYIRGANHLFCIAEQ